MPLADLLSFPTRRSSDLEMPPGAGGLPTLRLDIAYTAALPASRATVILRDDNFAGRAGWQEMVADASGGLALSEADRKSTRLNSSHLGISYAVFCLKKKK